VAGVVTPPGGAGPGPGQPPSERVRVTTTFGLVADVAAVYLLLKEGWTTVTAVLCIAAVASSIDAFRSRKHRGWAVTIIVVGVVTLVLALTGAHNRIIDHLWGGEPTPTSSAAPTPSSPAVPAPPAGPVAIGMTGGCTTFRVYAQNRFDPVGAAIRAAPTPTAPLLRTVAPNYSLFIDGFVHGDVAWPLNPAPWNSDIWFHLTDGGWVSYPGVRAVPTTYDPTGHGDGGIPVPTLDECLGALQ
jgi:hypothetical protein